MHKVELLAKSHDRDGFDCGREPPNSFLKQTARQHAERGISRTFVLVEESAAAPKPILGFFSLNICQIKSESLTLAEATKPTRGVSGVRRGRLAVSKAHQRQSIGKTSLVAAMGKSIEIFNSAGGNGLFVVARDQDAKHYCEQFCFGPMSSNELELFLPVRTIQEALASQN